MSGPAWERGLEVRTAAETHALAAALGAVLQTGDLLVLTGELGAGKTTFTQGLGEGDLVALPTGETLANGERVKPVMR